MQIPPTVTHNTSILNEVRVYDTPLQDLLTSNNRFIHSLTVREDVDLEVSKLLYYQLAHLLDKEMIPNYQASMEKLFVTEAAQRITRSAMEILGLPGQLTDKSKWAPLAGKVQYYFRWSKVETLVAGTSEVQRNIIAQRGLELPRT